MQKMYITQTTTWWKLNFDDTDAYGYGDHDGNGDHLGMHGIKNTFYMPEGLKIRHNLPPQGFVFEIYTKLVNFRAACEEMLYLKF